MQENNTDSELEEEIPLIGAINPPQIAHVYVKLSYGQYDNKLQVKALHDSGCAKSIIHSKIFEKIPNYEKIKITPLPNVRITSFSGERTNVLGFVTLNLTFEGDNGNRLSFLHDVLVHDKLEHDFLLGRDFTGSPVKVLETNNHIFFSTTTEANSIENLWERQKRNYVDVPIICKEIQTHQVNSNCESWIPPHSLVGVIGHLKHDNYIPILGKSKNDSAAFEVQNLQQPILKFPSALLNMENTQEIAIPVYNPTSEDIFIPANAPLAKIKFWEQQNPIYNLNISMDESINFNCNNVHINSDEIMTEEEKNDAFQEYLETGKFQMPMSSYIEKTPSITEMSLKNIKPFSEKEFEKQFDIDHLPPNARKQAKRIFYKNKNVFSKHEMDLGCSENVEMDIEIDHTKPRIQKYYPLPYAVRDGVRTILDQMLEFNIIRECPEPSLFVSNLLVTKKKNGEYRILLDGRLLNNAMIRKATTLVAPLEIFAALAQKKYVSIFDVSNAFFQIPIKFSDQPLTAFYSEAHGKRYCYTRAPQGLKNSPLYLKLLMDRMLGQLSKYVIHYADDVMIATDGSLAHHLDIIDKVLRQFNKEKIKIRPQKMEIAKPQIEFLGVLWKQGTLNIPKARVQAFLDMTKPNTPKRVKSFVCAMSYYRRFIPNFANLAKPLMDISNVHPKQFKWLKVHEDAFKSMLNAIEHNTSLNLPNPQETFYVQTDASDVAGAGRIFQKDKDGNEKLLACVSRTFTKAERKYGVFRKEVLALLYCLKSMDFFLRFAPKLVFLIDAKSIIFLRLCKESAGILLRFSLELSKYEAEIHHIPGAKNEISDLMSRAHKDIDTIISENRQKNILSEKQSAVILNRLTIPSGQIFTSEEVACLLEMDSLPGPPTKRKKPESKSKFGIRQIKNTPQTMGEKNVKLPPTSHRRPGVILPKQNDYKFNKYNNNNTKNQRNNKQECNDKCYNNSLGLICSHTNVSYSEFGNLSKIILPGSMSKKTFADIQETDHVWGPLLKKTILPVGYKKIDGMLFKTNNSNYRLCLPSSLLEAIIVSKHFTVMGLHFSKSRIRRDIMRRYFCHIPSLNKRLKEVVKSCIQCQFNASSPQTHTFKPIDIVFAPRVSWAVDIIPSLTPTENGNNAIFLAVDMFTGYIQLQAIKSRHASEMIEAVKTTILNPFGIPKYFRCDNESGMANSAEFLKFMEPLKINFMPCSTGSPWSNGAAERAVQSIKKAIRHFIVQEKTPEKWDSYIHFFTLAHNKSANVYNYSPEELHFGVQNPSTTDLIELWPQFSDRDEYMEKIVPIAIEARNSARLKALQKNKKVMTYRNQNRREKVFSPGQIVIHRQLQVSTGQGGALKPLFTGPYVIDSIDKDNSSATIEHLHTKQQMQAHFTNMQLLQYDPSMARLPAEFDENLNQFLPEKDSLERYHPKAIERRKRLNEERRRSRERESQGSSESGDSIQENSFHSQPSQTNPFSDRDSIAEQVQAESYTSASRESRSHRYETRANSRRETQRELPTPYYNKEKRPSFGESPSREQNVERVNSYESQNDFDFGDPNFDPLSPNQNDENYSIPKITSQDGNLVIDDPDNVFGHRKDDGSYDYTGFTINDPHNVLGLGRGTTRIGNILNDEDGNESIDSTSQKEKKLTSSSNIKTNVSKEKTDLEKIKESENVNEFSIGQIPNQPSLQKQKVKTPTKSIEILENKSPEQLSDTEAEINDNFGQLRDDSQAQNIEIINDLLAKHREQCQHAHSQLDSSNITDVQQIELEKSEAEIDYNFGKLTDDSQTQNFEKDKLNPNIELLNSDLQNELLTEDDVPLMRLNEIDFLNPQLQDEFLNENNSELSDETPDETDILNSQIEDEFDIEVDQYENNLSQRTKRKTKKKDKNIAEHSIPKVESQSRVLRPKRASKTKSKLIIPQIFKRGK